MVNTKVTLSGITLDNPVIPASGTFGFGYEFNDIYDINILGAISIKGTTREARFGNPTPRIAECYAGMINAVGLQNRGVEHFIENDLAWLKSTGTVVIANVAGKTLDDYKKRKYTKDIDYLSDAIGYMLNYIWAEKDNMDELVDSIDAMGEEYGD